MFVWLKLQVGEFSLEHAAEEGSSYYRQWSTIEAFPLYLWVDFNPLPATFLNFNYMLERSPRDVLFGKERKAKQKDAFLYLKFLEYGWRSRLGARIAEVFIDKREQWLADGPKGAIEHSRFSPLHVEFKNDMWEIRFGGGYEEEDKRRRLVLSEYVDTQEFGW